MTTFPKTFMFRFYLLLVSVGVGSVSLLSAHGKAKSEKQPAFVRVLLPTANAKVTIDDQATKQTGETRLFVSPPLDPAKDFTYTVTVKWDPNNYTTVIRTRVVDVKAGQQVEVDLRKADDKNPDKFLIIFIPTPTEVVEAMCKLANVGKEQVVIDDNDEEKVVKP